MRRAVCSVVVAIAACAAGCDDVGRRADAKRVSPAGSCFGEEGLPCDNFAPVPSESVVWVDGMSSWVTPPGEYDVYRDGELATEMLVTCGGASSCSPAYVPSGETEGRAYPAGITCHSPVEATCTLARFGVIVARAAGPVPLRAFDGQVTPFSLNHGTAAVTVDEAKALLPEPLQAVSELDAFVASDAAGILDAPAGSGFMVVDFAGHDVAVAVTMDQRADLEAGVPSALFAGATTFVDATDALGCACPGDGFQAPPVRVPVGCSGNFCACDTTACPDPDRSPQILGLAPRT